MTQRPLPFQSQTIGKGGSNWSVVAYTIQDLEADPSGEIIYAEGICRIFTQATIRDPRIITATYSLNNRCIEIINGKPAFIRQREVYKQADAKAALTDIVQKLSIIGMQHT